MQGDDEYAGSEDLVNQFFSDSLGDLERRRRLERTGRLAAEIEIDLEESGPLGLYVKSRREEAAEAMRVLAAIDPRDAITITDAQATVREYLRVCDWVAARMEEAVEAEREIKRDYLNEGTDESN